MNSQKEVPSIELGTFTDGGKPVTDAASAERVAVAVEAAAILALSSNAESFESKMTNARSTIERWNVAVSNDEGYGAVKTHVDAAYAILRTVVPASLSAEEKATFEEVQDAHNDLARDFAMMDEPEEGA